MPQPLPRRIQALFPGETVRAGYTFFRDCAARPRFDFTRRDPGAADNAWWCGQLALLAYVDEPDIRAALTRAGLTLVRPVIEADDLRAIVAASADWGTVFVAFRGTVLPLPGWPIATAENHAALNNWAHNLDAAPVAAPLPAQGLVHAGFKSAWEKLQQATTAALSSLPNKRTIVWTGHSLGGALATVGCALSTPPEGCHQVIVTFGSPRVGDAGFVAALEVPHARFVLGSDLVPGLPPADALGLNLAPGYVHHGTEIPLRWASPILDGPEVVRLIDAQIGLPPGPDLGAVLELGAIPVPLRDHAMLLYAAKCAPAPAGNGGR